MEVRARARELEGQFGPVVIWRHGIRGPEDSKACFPADEQFNLPAELYSHPLRERTMDEARRAAWEQAVTTIDQRTGGHVPKRQAEQLAARATQDFEAFYEQRTQPANDALSADALLVLSSDSKGIRMRPEALCDATRKEAEQQAAKAIETEKWVARFLTKLLTRPVETVIADTCRAAAARGLATAARKPVDRCLGYFERPKSMMNYPTFLKQGLPIATGVIELRARRMSVTLEKSRTRTMMRRAV